MATQSIRNFTQATGRNLGGLSANTARRPDLPFLPSMGMPKPAPAMAPPPGGRLVPGRSGSMVWQRDSLPTTTPTPPPSSGSAFDSPPSTPEPAPAPSFDNSPLSGDMGLGKPLEFGGFRAKGGPVRPGAAYVVGEQSPELFVPDRPGQIVPLNNNPVTGRPSTFDGMPRATFFAKNAGKTAGTLPVYNDIRQTMAGQPVRPDPRSFGTGGQNFMGPPMPKIPPTLDAQTGQPPTLDAQTGQPVPMRPSTGMLVPSSMGGVKWQPGTGPGTADPPQMPSRGLASLPDRPLPPLVPAQAAPFVSTGSAMDRHMSTGLAGSPRRQVGRSIASAPERRLETAARHGDKAAAMALAGFHQSELSRDFSREQNDTNFQQQQTMFGQQQRAMDMRDANQYLQRQLEWQQQQAASNARDERNFEQQQQLEAGRSAAAKAAAAEAAAGRSISGMSILEAPDGSGYVPMVKHADGTVSAAGGYMPRRATPPAAPEVEAFIKKAEAAGFTALNVPGEGWLLKPKARPEDEGVLAFNPSGETKLFPAGYELPPNWQPMKRKAAQPPAGGSAPPPKSNPFSGKTTPGGFRIMTGQMPSDQQTQEEKDWEAFQQWKKTRGK